MTTLEAPIVAVTVYVNRARVTRQGSIQLTPGEHTLTLTQLPMTIEEDSVRASGKGANVRILGVDTDIQFMAQPPEEALAELREQLETLQDQDKALVDNDATQAARLEFLNTLRDAGSTQLARGLARNTASLDSVASLSDYLAQELDSVHAVRRTIAQQRRELTREIEASRARLKQIQRKDSQARRDIQVMVEATADTELELEVSYLIAGASWEPVYDIRLIDNRVTVSYLALVRQQSGEDWPAVQLALSTARPAVTTTIPELQPWYLDIPRPPRPQPTAQMKRRQAAPEMQELQQDVATTDAAMSAVAETATPLALAPAAPPIEAEIEQAGASVTYRIARPVAIPSDGSPHRTNVTTLDFESNLDYITAPKMAEEAYLRATITNSSEFVLLPGSASVFHEDDFVGKTVLETTAPNEEFEVQLGIDDRLKVKRELMKRTVDKTLIGNTRRILFTYKITLTNLQPRPAQVTVFDQVPVGRHESIKVKLQEISPKPTEQSDLNILKWNMTIAPQRQKELIFTFQIEHPRDRDILGLWQ
ncbi:MAG: mucoidy inhibitor MuiA family protein [Chloroflexota bacterium]